MLHVIPPELDALPEPTFAQYVPFADSKVPKSVLKRIIPAVGEAGL